MKILKYSLSFSLIWILGFLAYGQGYEPGIPEPEKKPEPPFSGTIFINPDILTSSDPSSFLDITPTGQDTRSMYDRRVQGRIKVEAYLFEARYDDGLTAEIQVNPEFGNSRAAHKVATEYAGVIGRLPTVLRKDVETVSIHKGGKPFGGGGRGLLIHTGMGERYKKDGILEETLVHEASHTSLDHDHARAPQWLKAQKADGRFISTYAREHPFREDIAESYLLYVAMRYRANRIPDSLKNTIQQVMPNRMQYFEDQGFDMHPVR